MPLIGLVQDLMRDKSLRKRFVESPKSVMDEYGLKPRQRRILLTMDPPTIKQYVPAQMGDEIDDFSFDGDEFLPASDDFLSEYGGIDPQYPSPQPGIFRYRINPPFQYSKDAMGTVHRGFSAAIVNAKVGGVVELTVFGQSFSDAEVKLIRASDNVEAVRPGNLMFLMGTFRNSILRAVFNPPAVDGVWKAPDQYRVTVVNLKSAAAPIQTTHTYPTLLEVLP